MIEIERKFLVKSEAFKTDAVQKERIVQGFLNTDPLRTVRVRIKGDRGYITVKGKGNQNGTTRFEWEKEISVKEADALMNLSEPGVIDKTRYFIEVGKHIFEVDEFFGDNSGLIIAEVELEHEDEDFLKPQWLGDEVTSDIKYYNSQLSKNPFKTWKK
ncbi:CYTH domain-containing protein [Arenibacter palladensis]|uniref:CYTH domain-containing protein n=1 Tax=Arenibacter palladensis TaxID=237373 RepID=UPI0026E3FF05|nr:CYTH domain-containing protein [Arenibacter palladensis]MDO6601462.1 CYTH domain-containing protein [Arenibacter palladensis]|tara:strand:- start:6758 stop:7231 length:474 start_codon:yes stop_codon:yes gene_type:complete